jgi:hypothetical protein
MASMKKNRLPSNSTISEIKNYEQCRAFLKNTGFCLRYGANNALPISSMFDAIAGKSKDLNKAEQTLAIELTNELLQKHEVVEVNVIADRVCLVHRTLIPCLYKMVRNKSLSGALASLSRDAKEILALIEEKGEITTGDVRRQLGIQSSKTSDDHAYVILGELQRNILIDRGPFKVTNKAIPYLSKEGYPYHLFTEAHPELAKEADEMSLDDARSKWLLSFLRVQKQCPVKKMTSIFKRFLTPEEVDATLDLFIPARKIKLEKQGRNMMAVVL